MEKIPTAEKFMRGQELSISSIQNMMIQFAKLHVEQALKEIEMQRCIHHYPPIQFINKTYLIKNIK